MTDMTAKEKELRERFVETGKFTGIQHVILAIPMFEEASPTKAAGRIINRLQTIYGTNMKMYLADEYGTVPILSDSKEIKPYVDKDTMG